MRGGMLWRISGEGWDGEGDQVRGGMLWKISGEGWDVVKNIR